MASHPLVSCIIPTYNRANELPFAIESILNQTYKNLEIIIVDDGSTDNTSELMPKYKDKVLWITQSNQGASSARNKGITSSNGEYIAFLDSDDTWLPNKIERQIDLLRKYNFKLPCCLCNIKFSNSESNLNTSFNFSWLRPDKPEGIWLNPFDVLSTRFVLFNQSIIVKRESLNEIGIFDTSLRYMEDHDLALRLAMLGSWAYINEPLVVWNTDSNESLTKQATQNACELSKTIYNIYLKTYLLRNNFNLSKSLIFKFYLEMKRVQLLMYADLLIHNKNFILKLIGTSIKRLERLIVNLYSISPWYPMMKCQ